LLSLWIADWIGYTEGFEPVRKAVAVGVAEFVRASIRISETGLPVNIERLSRRDARIDCG